MIDLEFTAKVLVADVHSAINRVVAETVICHCDTSLSHIARVCGAIVAVVADVVYRSMVTARVLQACIGGAVKPIVALGVLWRMEATVRIRTGVRGAVDTIVAIQGVWNVFTSVYWMAGVVCTVLSVVACTVVDDDHAVIDRVTRCRGAVVIVCAERVVRCMHTSNIFLAGIDGAVYTIIAVEVVFNQLAPVGYVADIFSTGHSIRAESIVRCVEAPTGLDGAYIDRTGDVVLAEEFLWQVQTALYGI